MTQISPKRLSAMGDKEFRHEFMQEMLRGWISHQIKTNRDQRNWTQEKLGAICGKPQAAIGRLESPNYGRWTLNTLMELAEAFDVALQVRFVEWPEFIRWTSDLGDGAMRTNGWSEDQFALAPLTTVGGSRIPESYLGSSRSADENRVEIAKVDPQASSSLPVRMLLRSANSPSKDPTTNEKRKRAEHHGSNINRGITDRRTANAWSPARAASLAYGNPSHPGSL